MEIAINAGEQTEDLLRFVTANLTDADLDAIEVDREFEEIEGLATEPVTIAAVITASGAIVATVATLIAKWIETRRQADHLELILRGYRESPQAGDALLQLSKVHAGVKVTAQDMK
jgi:hypothetical protein